MAAPKVEDTTIEALNRAMEQLKAVGKGEVNGHQGYSFRGIDAVLNAVGPVFREVGIVVVPRVVDRKVDRFVNQRGSKTTVVDLTVDYEFHAVKAAADDVVTARVVSEAFDTSDKATSKAMSVAYRMALIQVLCLPTQEPDPDSDSPVLDHVPDEAQQQPVAPYQPQPQQPAPPTQVYDTGGPLPTAPLAQQTRAQQPYPQQAPVQQSYPQQAPAPQPAHDPADDARNDLLTLVENLGINPQVVANFALTPTGGGFDIADITGEDGVQKIGALAQQIQSSTNLQTWMLQQG